MVKKHIRHRALLDEGLNKREDFPQTNNLHDIKHIEHDFHSGGMLDPVIYIYAAKQKRLIATYNITDFRKLHDPRNKSTGIISISTSLGQEDIDKKLCSLLNKSKKGDLYGKITPITGETGKKSNQ